MSTHNPKTQAEWEAFRFPPRCAGGVDGSLIPHADEDDDESGEEGEGGEEGPVLEPQPPKVVTWLYMPDERRFIHPSRRKQVQLDHLDEASKIVRAVAVFERQDLDVEGFLDALEQASRWHHGCGLSELVHRHADGRSLTWPLLEVIDSPRRRSAFSG